MKFVVIIVALISAAMIAVAIMLSYNPNLDFKSDLDGIPVYTEPDIKWDLYIETTTADYWERVKGLNKNKETSETDVFVTDENGENVTDEDGKPITEARKNDENITDEDGETVTDKKSKNVKDKKNKAADDDTDNKVSVTDVPVNNKSDSESAITAN